MELNQEHPDDATTADGHILWRQEICYHHHSKAPQYLEKACEETLNRIDLRPRYSQPMADSSLSALCGGDFHQEKL